MGSVLRIGFDHPFQPFGLVDRGEPRGMLIELVAAALRRADREFEWDPMTLEETEPALYSGRVDALAFKGVTPERHATMDFSATLVTSGAALFRRPELPGSDDPRDFSGRRVVTPRRGPLAHQLEERYPALKLLLVDSYEASFEALRSGETDLAALNMHAGIAMVHAQHPGEIGLPRAPYAPLPIALAVAKGKHSELLIAFDAALASLQADGTAQRVIDRWLRGEEL